MAEDEPFDLEICKENLAERGHDVAISTNGEDCLKIFHYALSQLSNNGNAFQACPFDVVVIDFLLPKMNGKQVAEEILTISPKQRIIFTTAYLMETLIRSIDELKSFDIAIVQKPFEPKVLVDMIENSHYAVSDEVWVAPGSKLLDNNQPSSKDNVRLMLEKLRNIQRT